MADQFNPDLSFTGRFLGVSHEIQEENGVKFQFQVFKKTWPAEWRTIHKTSKSRQLDVIGHYRKSSPRVMSVEKLLSYLSYPPHRPLWVIINLDLTSQKQIKWKKKKIINYFCCLWTCEWEGVFVFCGLNGKDLKIIPKETFTWTYTRRHQPSHYCHQWDGRILVPEAICLTPAHDSVFIRSSAWVYLTANT